MKGPLPGQLQVVDQTWTQWLSWILNYKLMEYDTKAYHSGIVELSKLSALSRLESLSRWNLYLLSLNISSAFWMLNEQHMPLFEGNKVKILGQGRVKPFQAHHLNIPEIKMKYVKLLNWVNFCVSFIYHTHDCSCLLHSLHQNMVTVSSKAVQRVICSYSPYPCLQRFVC